MIMDVVDGELHLQLHIGGQKKTYQLPATLWEKPAEVSRLLSGQKASKGQGDAVVHISSDALASLVLSLPPLPEQQAIASILSDMDSEITGLEQELGKLRELKQGMMQELLTGWVRLVEGENKNG